jgi:hypothetical protein
VAKKGGIKMKLPKTIKIMTHKRMDIQLWDFNGEGLGIAVVNAAGEPLWQTSILRHREEIERGIQLAYDHIEKITKMEKDEIVIDDMQWSDIDMWDAWRCYIGKRVRITIEEIEDGGEGNGG